MDKIRYDNIGYTALIFELMSFYVWIYMIVCIYNHNFIPLSILIVSVITLFFCTFSLLGERNDMLTIDLELD